MAAASPSRLIDPRIASPVTAAGRILLLSSNADFAHSISGKMQAADFAILAVGSPDLAVQALDGDTPVDVVLLDAGHDSKSFEAWMERLLENLTAKRNAGQPQPAILLLTEAEQVSRALEGIRLGAYDYVLKPFSDEQMLAAVRRAVEYRRLRVQNDLFRHHLEQLITARTNMLEHAMHQLEQSYDITLEALGNALDLKDAETEGHSKRVTAYTLALGRAMGLNEPQLRMVGRGAFLHDIGKMAIPDAILRKPGKLTAKETDVMRTHSELGYRMIHKIPYLREASEIVYAHQECFDGTGYPRGLRGEQIPIGARIFALADTFDAITSNRPYRKANSINEARKEVLRCAGTQFDPAIVDVFVATPSSIWQNLREGIMRDGPEFSPFGYTFGEVR
jgi:putative nucleotidyltransferase with HDIG domain